METLHAVTVGGEEILADEELHQQLDEVKAHPERVLELFERHGLTITDPYTLPERSKAKVIAAAHELLHGDGVRNAELRLGRGRARFSLTLNPVRMEFMLFSHRDRRRWF